MAKPGEEVAMLGRNGAAEMERSEWISELFERDKSIELGEGLGWVREVGRRGHQE